jgi:hypothetical protein
MFPAGGQRGSKVIVKCSGSFEWPVSFSSPGVEIEPTAEKGVLKLAIPPNLAADRVWLRMYNAEGASARVPFLIGSLPEISEEEPNNSVPTALALFPGSGWTVNGTLEGGDVDSFAIPLNAGETLVASLDANNRLGSPMDAMLQVVSSDGYVQADNNDDIFLDPRLAYTATKSGIHIVRLFAFSSTPNTSISLQGASNYVYRLTLTTGPFITHAAPLGVGRQGQEKVEVFGWNIPHETKLPVVPFGTPYLGESQEFEPVADLRSSHDAAIGLVFSPDFAGETRVRLLPHAAKQGIVRAADKTPHLLLPPATVTGWLKEPKQTDCYRIPLKKGEQVVVSVETRSLMFPLDPLLKLTDPTGAVAAQFEDATPVVASMFAHVAAHDGDYLLTVTDRTGQGGERCFYRLTAKLERPDFELAAATDALVVAPGKPTEFPLTIFRRAASDSAVGSITIEAVGLPAGISAPAVVSEPSGPTAGKVTLVFNTNGTPFSGAIRIVGKATQPQELERYARTPAKLGNTFETFWLTGTK